MIRHLSRWKWALLALAVSACAATPLPLSGSGGTDTEEATEAASFEELCEEASSLVALCSGEQCGLYRCQEVNERFPVRRVVPVLNMRAPLANPQAGPQRTWGSAQELPWDTRPVLIIIRES